MKEPKIVVKEGVQHIDHRLNVRISVSRFIEEHPELEPEPVNPEAPNEYTIKIKECEDQRFRLSEVGIRGFVKPSIWDRIKGDFQQFLKDIEWEKFKKDDMQIEEFRKEVEEFKDDIKRVKKVFR